MTFYGEHPPPPTIVELTGQTDMTMTMTCQPLESIYVYSAIDDLQEFRHIKADGGFSN
jgi:hypothetical protein